jgi:ATP-dependent Clp protease ATP-binding subunit ClpA
VFDNFSNGARDVVTRAQIEARALRHNYLGTEHVLLGLFEHGQDPATRVLERLRVDHDAVRDAVREIIGMGPLVEPDQSALEAIGIDLQEVRRRIEEAFGPGALERTRAALGLHLTATRSRRRPRLLRRITRDCDASPVAGAGRLAVTPRTKKVFDLSRDEAGSLGHDRVAPAHLLLGLLKEGEGVAAQVLSRLGIDLQTARAMTVEELNAPE